MRSKKQVKYKELVSFFKSESAFHLSRVKFISLFMAALLKVQTVNFSRISEAFDSKVRLDSNLRRIQRFFAETSLAIGYRTSIILKYEKRN